jgi:hypothetical protein
VSEREGRRRRGRAKTFLGRVSGGGGGLGSFSFVGGGRGRRDGGGEIFDLVFVITWLEILHRERSESRGEQRHGEGTDLNILHVILS